MTPCITVHSPTHDLTLSIKAPIPLHVTVPAACPSGAPNPPVVDVRITDTIETHYVVTDPDPDLATPIIRIPPYQDRLIGDFNVPRNSVLHVNLPLLPVIGFHFIRVVASDPADPAHAFQKTFRVRIVYP
jgi:hypothetical protein